jgi:broad specificity phosphatase PhoE
VTEILLARHGETDWNRESRFQGHADPPLNDGGREQAVELAEALAEVELAAVYSSPLRRAFETAEVVAARHGLPALPVEGLREVDVGSWQGLTRDDVERRCPEQFKRWLDYGQGWDDGETYDAMGERVLAVLEELAARHDGLRILAVTHGGPIRAALAGAEHTSHSEARRRGSVIGNCFLARFAVTEGGLQRVASAL